MLKKTDDYLILILERNKCDLKYCNTVGTLRCVNTAGSYECVCNDGYSGVNCTTCKLHKMDCMNSFQPTRAATRVHAYVTEYVMFRVDSILKCTCAL